MSFLWHLKKLKSRVFIRLWKNQSRTNEKGLSCNRRMGIILFGNVFLILKETKKPVGHENPHAIGIDIPALCLDFLQFP
jgi:hypothetical protein